jgi:hypothetical protein
MSETHDRNYAWWDEPLNAAHDRMLSTVRYIRTNQSDRKLTDMLYASLYGGMPVTGFGLGSFVRRPLASSNRLSLNVVRNMVGAVTSKIAAKNKPKPTFLTEGGNYELREKAQKLEKFVGGVFYEIGVYAQLTKCFRDACVYGTGILKIYEGDGQVEVERGHPLGARRRRRGALYGTPRNMYQRKYVDRRGVLRCSRQEVLDR